MNAGVLEPLEVTSAWHRGCAMQTTLHCWVTADPGRRFDDVVNLVHDPVFLMAAWDRVRGTTGGRTAGVDGIVPRFVPAEEVTEMLADLRRQVNPLVEGVPSMTDRIVQASLKLVLEPIFEADVEPCLFWVPAEKTSPGRGR